MGSWRNPRGRGDPCTPEPVNRRGALPLNPTRRATPALSWTTPENACGDLLASSFRGRPDDAPGRHCWGAHCLHHPAHGGVSRVVRAYACGRSRLPRGGSRLVRPRRTSQSEKRTDRRSPHACSSSRAGRRPTGWARRAICGGDDRRSGAMDRRHSRQRKRLS